MSSLHVTLSILAKSATRFRPLPQQTDEGLTLASDALDYMLKHREELDPRHPTLKIGMQALKQILTDPESVLRVSELSEYLAGVEKRMSDGKQ